MCGNAKPNRAPALVVAVLVAAHGSAATPSASAAENAESSATSPPSVDLFDRLDKNHDGQIVPDETPPEHRRLFARLLRTSDKNGDGLLNREELARGLTPSTPDKPITPPKSAELRDAKFGRLLLLKLDANGDTTLTRGEAPADLRPAFERIAENADRNKDGVVSRLELNRGGPRVIGIGRRFAKRGGWDVDAELARFEQEQGEAVYRFDNPIGPMEALGDPKAARELFNRLDTDGDQLLMRSELPEQLRERFERLFRRADTNRDDALSRAEYLEASQRLSRFLERAGVSPPTPDKPAKKSADKKNGGRNAVNEAAVKKNRGIDTKEKASSGSVAERLMRRMVERADRNGDGRLTRGEATGPMARRFDEADLNRDGLLDADELAAATRRLDKKLRSTGRASNPPSPRRGE